MMNACLVDSLTCLKLANEQQIVRTYVRVLHHGGKLLK